ncbi:hypothetical protein Agau_C100830 [Agrobacterium tumefaciens F2]|nr:hypothetical protein Agau_C100830 [Agrobacterium tumefaciens F2]
MCEPKKTEPDISRGVVTRFCMFVSGIANDDMINLIRPAPE